MYILDEVDAALDLSHTQNIGHLFQTRFKGSQFIVVSLKDGMFANANVIFRAKFANGTSHVERSLGQRRPLSSTSSVIGTIGNNSSKKSTSKQRLNQPTSIQTPIITSKHQSKITTKKLKADHGEEEDEENDQIHATNKLRT